MISNYLYLQLYIFRDTVSIQNVAQAAVSVCSSLAFVCIGLARAWASTAVPSMTAPSCAEDQLEQLHQLRTLASQNQTSSLYSSSGSLLANSSDVSIRDILRNCSNPHLLTQVRTYTQIYYL